MAIVDIMAEEARACDADAVADTLCRALANSRRQAWPYRHWLLGDCIPPAACDAIAALPLAPRVIGDTLGKRDTHNEGREFFSPANQKRFPVVRALSEALQSEPVVRAVERLCAIRLSGSSLRIEYCQDSESFWLEPHTDIKPKRITMQIYLNREREAEALGTTLYDAEKRAAGRVPAGFNRGYLFVPADDTWHGFEPLPHVFVRRSLIVNFVTPEWRARHELSFPDRAVA